VSETVSGGGYSVPKALIVIDGKPIIQHVVELFPGETKFTFICNRTHIAATDMRDVLLRIAPGSNIVEIPEHKSVPFTPYSRQST